MQTKIANLKSKGYLVEDMGEEWGPEFKGQYRWVLMPEPGKMQDFQDNEPSYSEQDAWKSAELHNSRKVSEPADLA